MKIGLRLFVQNMVLEYKYYRKPILNSAKSYNKELKNTLEEGGMVLESF